MKVNQNYQVYFFTFTLAFCSLFYELIYAQVLSVCLGGTKNQYITIISLFTCALGLGSIYQSKVRLKYSLFATFFTIEVLLTILGSLGPFFITWILQPGEDFTIVKMVTSYALVFIIGLLSGFEIPCLFSMIPDAQGRVLAFDYLGMLAASITFPFLFLPGLGTAASALVVSGFNGLALIWLLSTRIKRSYTVLLLLLSLVYFSLVLNNRHVLNQFLSNLYLGGQ